MADEEGNIEFDSFVCIYMFGGCHGVPLSFRMDISFSIGSNDIVN